jgi:hypothetical protein
MKKRANPYRWYIPFKTRLRHAIHMDGHRSDAYTGTEKKPAWSWWRREVARIFIIIDAFIGQPEYYILGHYPLTYCQCGRLRRRLMWQTRLYLWAAGYSQEK